MGKAAAEAENISIGYGKGEKRKVVSSGINFLLNCGEMTLLLGQNGVGKSTLLRTVAAVQPPLEGRILINGSDIADYDMHSLSRLVSVVFTDKTLAGGLRVNEVVALGRYPYTGFFGRLSFGDEAIVGDSLSAVGMVDRADAFLSQLSDGERQKVMIAKALAQQSQIILLDEPTAFLDLPSRVEILYLLKRLAVEQNKTILLSTHDIEQSLPVADRILLFLSGSITCGKAEDVIAGDGLECIFAGRGVDFDKVSGRFVPKQKGAEVVYLSVSDSIVYWVESVVRGAGFDVVRTDSKTVRLKVKCETTDMIVLEFMGKTERLGSLSALGKRLRELINK
ncbi:MAG: ABC transporter ATP-binding protein [Bacteroidales bacterium]